MHIPYPEGVLFEGEQEPSVQEGGGVQYVDMYADAAIHKINLPLTNDDSVGLGVLLRSDLLRCNSDIKPMGKNKRQGDSSGRLMKRKQSTSL